VPATTIDRQCGSSQQSAHFAAQGVIAGAYDVVVAAGVEVMTTTPMGASITPGSIPFGPKVMERYDLVPQGISAEIIADRWGLTREDLDAFGAESQRRAAQARDEGRFDNEIIPVTEKRLDKESGKLIESDELVTADEGIREGTTAETLANLKPAFKPDGKVTAGNSSQITDGASAVLIMSEEKANELGLKPRARFHTFALAGVDPVTMLTGPIPATEKVLARSGLTIDDIDLFEVNEAFASVVLAWNKDTGGELAKTNVNGGAIALGHPLGCSGTKLLATLVNELERSGGRYGLQTMCEGGGMANATIIERL
jgi:acetyl-CoA acyltransferase